MSVGYVCLQHWIMHGYNNIQYCMYVPVNFQGAKVINMSMPRHELIQKVVQHLVVEPTTLKLCEATFI